MSYCAQGREGCYRISGPDQRRCPVHDRNDPHHADDGSECFGPMCGEGETARLRARIAELEEALRQIIAENEA